MNVLVGRNNSGKTAILRGLSALSALPLSPSIQQVPSDLSGYGREGGSGLEIQVLTTIEDSEKDYFEAPLEQWWAQVTGLGVARWRFRFVETETPLHFVQCDFTIPGPNGGTHDVTGLRTNGQQILRAHISYPDLVTKSHHVISQGSIGRRGGGPPGPFFNAGSTEVAGLQSIGNIKLISPHRVVLARQALQTALNLPGDAQNLSQFLLTLYGRDRDKYEAIEKFLIAVFPEFRHVNPVTGPDNQVSIDLTETSTNRRVALANCGTGVEQILILATFVLTTPSPGIILLDEPHSYLHPTAERALVRFLEEHSEHTYVISTHSAVLMNSVELDRIVYIAPPGQSFGGQKAASSVSRVLFDLGYKNSDALFNDQLVFVEGKSDAEILPILLEQDGEIEPSDINRTGFPALGGVGMGTTALQTAIDRYEKLLGEIGRVTSQESICLMATRERTTAPCCQVPEATSQTNASPPLSSRG